MKRKTFIKKLNGIIYEAHKINLESGGELPYKMGLVYSASRLYKLPGGKSYSDVFKTVCMVWRGSI